MARLPYLLLSALIAILIGCQQPATPAAPVRAPLAVEGSSSFTMNQRTTAAIPGSAGQLLLTIDDITGGQTMASLEWRDGERLLGPRAMYLNDSVDFSIGAQNWRLTLTRMHNELIGMDWAEFTLSARAEPGSAPDATREIEALLAAVAALDGAEFIRNGQSYTAAAAAQHLREKWQAAGPAIDSAEDFIVAIGSRSSTSGEVYTIRRADGSSVNAEDWFRAQLLRMRQAR